MSEPLTPQRLFSHPPLQGTAPTSLSYSPDGEFVYFRALSAEDRTRYDLFRQALVPDSARELVVDTQALATGGDDVSRLTAEERAERERRRDFSSGVTQYFWRPGHAELLIAIDGNLFRLPVGAGVGPLKPLFAENTRQSAFQVSPKGRYVSFVRERNLYVLDLTTMQSSQLSHHTAETVQSGLADFLAAEEMHRFVGHWWAPDETSIYFCTVDEAPVPISYRLEMTATDAHTIAQRYPYAGGTNPTVQLTLHDLTHNHAAVIWDNTDTDEYLARVNFRGVEPVIQIQDQAAAVSAISAATRIEVVGNLARGVRHMGQPNR